MQTTEIKEKYQTQTTFHQIYLLFEQSYKNEMNDMIKSDFFLIKKIKFKF